MKDLKFALVWGRSTKFNPQKVGKDHVLEDEVGLYNRVLCGPLLLDICTNLWSNVIPCPLFWQQDVIQLVKQV